MHVQGQQKESLDLSVLLFFSGLQNGTFLHASHVANERDRKNKRTRNNFDTGKNIVLLLKYIYYFKIVIIRKIFDHKNLGHYVVFKI